MQIQNGGCWVKELGSRTGVGQRVQNILGKGGKAAHRLQKLRWQVISKDLEEDGELDTAGDSKTWQLKIMQPCRRMTREEGEGGKSEE